MRRRGGRPRTLQRDCPVVIADPAAYDALSDGDEVTVAATDHHATVRIDAPRIA
jgi:hypothetical protein